MADAQTQYDRAIEDAQANINAATKNIDYQIADVQQQLDRNIGAMTAEGAWG
jgi:hypothetical protein